MGFQRVGAVKQLQDGLSRVRLVFQQLDDPRDLIIWGLAKQPRPVGAVDGCLVVGKLVVARDVVLDEIQPVAACEYPQQFSEATKNKPSRFGSAEAGSRGREFQERAADFPRWSLGWLYGSAARKDLLVYLEQQVIERIGCEVHGVLDDSGE